MAAILNRDSSFRRRRRKKKSPPTLWAASRNPRISLFFLLSWTAYAVKFPLVRTRFDRAAFLSSRTEISSPLKIGRLRINVAIAGKRERKYATTNALGL